MNTNFHSFLPASVCSIDAETIRRIREQTPPGEFHGK